MLVGVATGLYRVIDRNRAFPHVPDFGAIGGVSTPPAPQSADDLPVLAEVPDFQLTDQDGALVTKASLRGKVWVADIFYTYCRGVCVEMSSSMAKLHNEYAGRAEPQFISVTSDPGRDKPAVLKDYAPLYKADTTRWRFLTGEMSVIHNLVVKGFLLTNEVGRPEMHSSRFVLIDREGRLRGNYDSRDPEKLIELRRDLSFLLKAPSR